MVRLQQANVKHAAFAARILLLLFLFWTFLTSCDGGEQPIPTAQAERFAAMSVDPATLALIRTQAKELQLGVVDDGILTFPEYERLFLGLQECLSKDGSQLEEVMLDAGGVYRFAVLSPPGADPSACLFENWEPLGPEWSLRHPPPATLLSAANEALAQCLRRAGVDIPAKKPGAADFQRLGGLETWLTQPYAGCSAQVSEEFGLWAGFVGS